MSFISWTCKGLGKNGLYQANFCGECEDDQEEYLEEALHILIYQQITIDLFLKPLYLPVSNKRCFLFVSSQAKFNCQGPNSWIHSTSPANELMVPYSKLRKKVEGIVLDSEDSIPVSAP